MDLFECFQVMSMYMSNVIAIFAVRKSDTKSKDE